MKARYLIIVFIFAVKSLSAQFSEIGVMIGTTYYMGDLNKKHFNNSKLASGLIYRYSFNSRVSFRMNLLIGKVEGDDSTSDNINN